MQLLDEGSPFLELSPLAGKDLYGKGYSSAATARSSSCSKVLP